MIVVFPDHTHLLFLFITKGIVSSKIYDKRDDFNFEIAIFPFFDISVTRPLPMVYLVRSSIILGEYVPMLVTFTIKNYFLTAKLLKQSNQYDKVSEGAKIRNRYKLRKTFSKFYHRHSEWTVQNNIGSKTLLQHGI